MKELPSPATADTDAGLLTICENACSTVQAAAGAMIDRHTKDISLSALSLLSEAEHKARLAFRLLHPDLEVPAP